MVYLQKHRAGCRSDLFLWERGPPRELFDLWERYVIANGFDLAQPELLLRLHIPT